jgi:hypothetical protein
VDPELLPLPESLLLPELELEPEPMLPELEPEPILSPLGLELEAPLLSVVPELFLCFL